ncbi:iron-containing alcohol dehydrogenase [Vibrio sp. PP-XX7]
MDAKVVFEEEYVSEIAIVDSSFGKTIPDNILRETIFDSFTHLFEALVSVKENEFIQSISANALKNLEKYLKKYRDEKKTTTFIKI